MKLSDIANILDCKFLVLKDNKFKNIASATAKSITKVLCYSANFSYLEQAINNDNVSCVITSQSLIDRLCLADINKGILIVEEPEYAFMKINNYLYKQGCLKMDYKFEISKSSFIGQGTIIEDNVFIGDNVVIGRNCIIYSNSIIHDNCIIEDNVTIGNEGLYFKRFSNGLLGRIYSTGGVILEKNVDVLNGTSIQKSHDLGLLTKVCEGAKLSVNVNIGHSSVIGKNTLISGSVQIAGRVIIGDDCWVGTSATISDSVVIGDRASVRIGSVVVKNVDDGQDVSGNFSYSHKKRLRDFYKLQKH